MGRDMTVSGIYAASCLASEKPVRDKHGLRHATLKKEGMRRWGRGRGVDYHRYRKYRCLDIMSPHSHFSYGQPEMTY